MKNDAMNLKERNMGHTGKFQGGKERGRWCDSNIIIKIKKSKNVIKKFCGWVFYRCMYVHNVCGLCLWN